MKRELFIHISYWVSFFIFVTLIHKYFNFTLGSSANFWPLWVGGLIGVFLPDIDHIIYAYLIKPEDLSSQRINYLIDKKEFVRSIELLYETRTERKGLIFHSVIFQIIFWILTFWIMSSSGSYFGRGLALSFALHLSVDQVLDLFELNSFENWITNTPFFKDINKAKIYWLGMVLILLSFGLLM